MAPAGARNLVIVILDSLRRDSWNRLAHSSTSSRRSTARDVGHGPVAHEKVLEVRFVEGG